MEPARVIEMTQKYPFNTRSPGLSCTVRLRRRFREFEHQELKNKIEVHSKLRHTCLIAISKAFESKKGRYFDIFLQHVCLSLKHGLFCLNLPHLRRIKQDLVDLSLYLLERGIYPIITEEVIGYEDGGLKYYLDPDFSVATGSFQELVKAKEIEINNLFCMYESFLQQHISGRKMQQCISTERINTVVGMFTQTNSPRENSRRYLGTNPHFSPQSNRKISQSPSFNHPDNVEITSHPYIDIDRQREQVCLDIPSHSHRIDQSGQVRQVFNQATDQVSKNEMCQVRGQQMQQTKIKYNLMIKRLESSRRLVPQQAQVQNSKLSYNRDQGKSTDMREVLYKMGSTQSLFKSEKTVKKVDVPPRISHQSMYHQAFGIKKNDPLTKEFNVLFDQENDIVSQSKFQQLDQEKETASEINMDQLKRAWMQSEKVNAKAIQARVRNALLKTEEAMETFRKRSVIIPQ